jgi:ABC-type uncharacterized transport system fused permease/ATPase subunit
MLFFKLKISKLNFLKLWPLFGGSVIKPEKGKLFYIPQVIILSLI